MARTPNVIRNLQKLYEFWKTAARRALLISNAAIALDDAPDGIALLAATLEDAGTDAVKIGMLANASIVRAVAAALADG